MTLQTAIDLVQLAVIVVLGIRITILEAKVGKRS